MLAEGVSLASVGTFLSEVLKAILSDKGKEWMTSAPPEVKGKRAAFELYQCLERVSFQTREFVEALVSLIAIAESPDSPAKEPEYFARCKELHDSLKALLTELKTVDDIIRWTLRPALEIHRPEIIQAIYKLQFDRSQPLPVRDPLSDLMESEEYQQEFAQLAKESVPKLKARLEAARQSEREVDGVIEEFRQLLAKEFSFKESFV